MKKSSLERLICAAKTELESWLKKCHVSEEERKEFLCCEDYCYTDEVLETFERKISELQARHESMKPILQLLVKRQLIWNDQTEYTTLCQDPDRFKKPFALLHEEQIRKRVAKLPKLTELLLQQVRNWESENHTKFFFEGKSLTIELENDLSRLKYTGKRTTVGSKEGTATNNMKITTRQKQLSERNNVLDQNRKVASSKRATPASYKR